MGLSTLEVFAIVMTAIFLLAVVLVVQQNRSQALREAAAASKRAYDEALLAVITHKRALEPLVAQYNALPAGSKHREELEPRIRRRVQTLQKLMGDLTKLDANAVPPPVIEEALLIVGSPDHF